MTYINETYNIYGITVCHLYYVYVCFDVCEVI